MMPDAGVADPSVSFTGALTFQRFVAVQKALLPRWSHPLVTGACFVWILGTWSGTSSWYEPATLAVNVPIAAAIVSIVWGATRFTYRRHWRRMTALHGALAGTVGATGIRWKTGIGESFFPWEKIVRAREIGDMVLLHYAPRCALYFPREFFADEAAWEAFRSIVRTRAKQS
jgi:hypothetical protein